MAAPRRPEDKIGTGFALPFRLLGGAGFATCSGAEVVLGQVELVLGETCAASGTTGTCIYNQALGTLIQRLRHKNTVDPATEEMAVYYVLNKLKQLVPQARIRKMSFTPDSKRRMITLAVGCDILDRAGGTPIAIGRTAKVTI